MWAGQEEAKLEGRREGGEGGAATSGYASDQVVLAFSQFMASLEVGWELVSPLSLRRCKPRLGKQPPENSPRGSLSWSGRSLVTLRVLPAL